MSLPPNPDNIILKNRYYPKGLSEKNIWQYYQNYKGKILQEVRNREIMLWLRLDNNQNIVVRKDRQNQFLRLTSQNYDEKNSGRMISIHSTMGKYEEIGIVDIDGDRYTDVKDATLNTYEYLQKNAKYVEEFQIRFTGKTGFHIYCMLYRKNTIDQIYRLLYQTLMESPLSKTYTVARKRQPGTVNLDLAPNKFRGGFITLHSLSIEGLKCQIVDINNLWKFDPFHARI